MTKDEALTMALEALEEPHPGVRTSFTDAMTYREKIKTAITAIKEALAQPERKTGAWKLVPVAPTEGMLKAMDECSTEGYDERLYAGHAASVYMAAVDAAPTQPTAHRTAGANFCPRCGKRLASGFVEISIHTCTPPRDIK